MKIRFQELFVVAGAVCIFCGCGDSNPTTSSNNAAVPAPPPAGAAPATDVVKTTVETGKAVVADLTSQFAKVAAAQSDKILGSVGSDLVDKVKSLGLSLGANTAVKSQVDAVVESLIEGQDPQALNTVFQVVKAVELTPQQLQLAKEVGNFTSAYVVQKNFSALDGAKGDVATIVNSLRKGEITQAIPAIQNVAQNTNLTPSQKQLISSLADQYAPGLKKASDSLQQGLKGIQNLPGVKK